MYERKLFLAALIHLNSTKELECVFDVNHFVFYAGTRFMHRAWCMEIPCSKVAIQCIYSQVVCFYLIGYMGYICAVKVTLSLTADFSVNCH
jgi:hypothetical protein